MPKRNGKLRKKPSDEMPLSRDMQSDSPQRESGRTGVAQREHPRLDPSHFERTPFGRRRKRSRSVVALFGLAVAISVPLLIVYHWLLPASGNGKRLIRSGGKRISDSNPHHPVSSGA
jgi:hypothetical protein